MNMLQSVATVLSSWGRKGDVVVQAGVIVARINLNNEGKDASYETSLLSLDADAAKCLFGKDSCSLRGRYGYFVTMCSMLHISFFD